MCVCVCAVHVSLCRQRFPVGQIAVGAWKYYHDICCESFARQIKMHSTNVSFARTGCCCCCCSFFITPLLQMINPRDTNESIFSKYPLGLVFFSSFPCADAWAMSFVLHNYNMRAWAYKYTGKQNTLAHMADILAFGICMMHTGTLKWIYILHRDRK